MDHPVVSDEEDEEYEKYFEIKESWRDLEVAEYFAEEAEKAWKQARKNWDEAQNTSEGALQRSEDALQSSQRAVENSLRVLAVRLIEEETRKNAVKKAYEALEKSRRTLKESKETVKAAFSRAEENEKAAAAKMERALEEFKEALNRVGRSLGKTLRPKSGPRRNAEVPREPVPYESTRRMMMDFMREGDPACYRKWKADRRKQKILGEKRLRLARERASPAVLKAHEKAEKLYKTQDKFWRALEKMAIQKGDEEINREQAFKDKHKVFRNLRDLMDRYVDLRNQMGYLTPKCERAASD